MSSRLWQRVRGARLYARLTQQALADRVGVTKQSVISWETLDPGKRFVPSDDNLSRIAAATGVPREWLSSDASSVDEGWLSARDEVVMGAPAWADYVAVTTLPQRWTHEERVPSSDGGGSLVAYRRSWVGLRQLEPGNLFSWVVDTDAFLDCGFRRGDTALVDVGDLILRDGFYLFGAVHRLVRVEVGLGGDTHYHLGNAEVELPDNVPVVGRLISHTRTLA